MSRTEFEDFGAVQERHERYGRIWSVAVVLAGLLAVAVSALHWPGWIGFLALFTCGVGSYEAGQRFGFARGITYTLARDLLAYHEQRKP